MAFEPRILHVLATPRAEGTPRLVLDWLAARPDLWQGVLVLNSQPGDLKEPLQKGSRAYREHDLLQPGFSQFPRIVQASYRMVRDTRPNIVLCWVTGMASWVCEGARLAGCKKLLVHSGNPPRLGGKNDLISCSVYWPLALLRAKVICCSDYVRDANRSIRGVSRGLFQTVYNCARAREISARATRARQEIVKDGKFFTAIMVATLEKHKDHETLLKAIPSIVSRCPNFRLGLVGEGSLRGDLEQLADRLGIREQVTFLGTRSDVPELLGLADLFVFSTTINEGLGSVLLEAMAAKLPVVATDVPACRELLQGGRLGQLVPPQRPELLAEAILDKIQNRESSAHTVPTAFDYVEQFTPARMIDQYLRWVR
ncbi:glycosyltransferase [Telmatocola sphagniphila]|uniref:Glycosyltransferase n=1 Tax=Telmatocola sphagniphila TaxID=1123043 RepID=A0A8E6BB93_9BACT|nr:glycosyltransferase [Telmatocola sphagniphila]QVL33770.1 glycosyltransferase [Telmatocola sphagniphila]